MFAVIYSFKIKKGQQENFIQAWSDMTQLIMKHEGGLGSRLHKKNDTVYIAYAQWPNRLTWEKSGNDLSGESQEIRQKIRTTCDKIEILHELDMVEDLLMKDMPA